MQSVKDSLRKVAMAGGYATEEEMDEGRAAWEEWATHEEARFMGLDGQIICFKRHCPLTKVKIRRFHRRNRSFSGAMDDAKMKVEACWFHTKAS